ncbi:MAG TPA: DctP family TRAP transporter solute-binding subunit [Burkholderiaceae bacterium]|nr:DctP family TRAP transporter solute-binding subunit [Burkholderiaceae bacterium]
MSMKRFRSTAAISALSLLVTFMLGATTAAHAKKQTLKLGHFSTAESTYGKGLYRFSEIVAEKTDGEVEIKIYNSGQLGNESQQIASLRSGIQAFFLVSSSPLTQLNPNMQILDFPGLLKDQEQAYKFLDGEAGTEILAGLEEKNLKGLAYWENGFRQFTNNRRAIESVEDFKGLKVRVIPSPMYIDMFENLGTHAVEMPFNELYTALETGIVDAQDNTMLTNEMAKFDEVQKHLTITNHIYNPMVLLVSKKIWDSLSEDVQEIIQEAALEAGQYNREVSQEAVESFIQAFEDGGVEVYRFSPEQTRAMTDMMRPAIDRYLEKLDASFIERAFKAADYAYQAED